MQISYLAISGPLLFAQLFTIYTQLQFRHYFIVQLDQHLSMTLSGVAKNKDKKAGQNWPYMATGKLGPG